ncbi:MAG: hypothetical protein IH898_04005 [Planctomycetes bacterium]|nr:hypothetical protein [Planctomycetota bacterium]
MPTLDQVHESLRGLETASPMAFVLAAAAGLLLALTPTVMATVPVVMGYVAGEPGLKRWKAATRSLAFVLGTATTFGVYGLIFAWAGSSLAPLFGANGYLIAGVVMVVLGLAMLGKLRLRVPGVAAPERRVESLPGAYALGLTYQKPEREYYEIDEAARKKWLRYEVPKIRRAVEKHRGILYFQDESNISLTTSARCKTVSID